MKFKQQTLPNGLQVIAECNEQAYSTSLAYFVNTGSRDETEDVAGVSHFLEHMVFKGTPTRSAADVNRELDEMGSESNAYTSQEKTVYYGTVLPEYQSQAVDLLSDMMRPSLREDDFNTEKKVIIDEIWMYEDRPPFNASDKCMDAYFGVHPLGRNIIGSEESIQNMTAAGMRKYFEQQYSPGNITLVACGNVDFDALVKRAEKNCGDWKPFDVSRERPTVSPQLGRENFTKESATQQYTVQMSSGPSADDPLRFSAGLLSYAVGDDSGSRLYWDLVDPGLVEYAELHPRTFDGTGIIMTFVCCAPEAVDENLERVAKIQREIDDNGITQDELDLVKIKVCSQLVRRSERPAGRLGAVGNSWLQRQEYKSVKETIDAYQAVTLNDIRQFLEAHPLSQTMTVSIGPDGS